MELLVFALDDQHFGIPVSGVREILRAATLTKATDAPGIEGAINVRGQVLAVVDVRATLGMPAKEMEHTDHLVVLGFDDEARAIIRVDRAIRLDGLSEEPAGGVAVGDIADLTRCFVKGDEGLIRVIDIDALLSSVGELTADKSLLRSHTSEPAE